MIVKIYKIRICSIPLPLVKQIKVFDPILESNYIIWQGVSNIFTYINSKIYGIKRATNLITYITRYKNDLIIR